jgi:hypothetical protein
LGPALCRPDVGATERPQEILIKGVLISDFYARIVKGGKPYFLRWKNIYHDLSRAFYNTLHDNYRRS